MPGIPNLLKVAGCSRYFVRGRANKPHYQSVQDDNPVDETATTVSEDHSETICRP
jgi:aldehyde:ferredoxin oxidoreductase